jgi:hypothetical protein
VVVEDRYSQVFKLDRVRPAVIADGLASRRASAAAEDAAEDDRDDDPG